jgi:hypothetical protein
MRALFLALLLFCTPLHANWLDDRVATHPCPGTPEQRGAVSFLFGMAGIAVALNQSNDKAAHFAAGLGASLAVGLTFQPVDGWVFGIGLGAAKEIYDIDHGTAELADFGATAAGATLAYGLIRGVC